MSFVRFFVFSFVRSFVRSFVHTALSRVARVARRIARIARIARVARGVRGVERGGARERRGDLGVVAVRLRVRERVDGGVRGAMRGVEGVALARGGVARCHLRRDALAASVARAKRAKRARETRRTRTNANAKSRASRRVASRAPAPRSPPRSLAAVPSIDASLPTCDSVRLWGSRRKFFERYRDKFCSRTEGRSIVQCDVGVELKGVS